MTQLFRILRRGGSWPPCPEGSAGGVNYQPHKDCPAGQMPVSRQTFSSGDGNSSYERWVLNDAGDYCVDAAGMSQLNNEGCGGPDTPACQPVTPTTRERHDDPYYVDITPQNSTPIRFRFSLQ